MKETYIGAVLVLVLSTLSLSAERVSETYDVKWRDVEKMAELVEGFVDGYVKYSQHFSALVVRGDPADHELVAKANRKVRHSAEKSRVSIPHSGGLTGCWRWPKQSAS